MRLRTRLSIHCTLALPPIVVPTSVVVTALVAMKKLLSFIPCALDARTVNCALPSAVGVPGEGDTQVEFPELLS